MINLFKARVQGSRDYIGGIKRCVHLYEAEEVAQWQIGWNTEQEIHSLSSAKKELGDKCGKDRELIESLKRDIEKFEYEYITLNEGFRAVFTSLGNILMDPPFFKRTILKRLGVIYDNIKIFEDLTDRDLESELEEISDVPVGVDVDNVRDLHDSSSEPNIGC